MKPPEVRHYGTPIPGVRLAVIRNVQNSEYVVMADGIELGAVSERAVMLGVRSVEIDWDAVRVSMGLPATG